MSINRLHNPKSHAPAVYIPCWLIQVPTSLLSNNAKILYGRLAQWSNVKGIVFRTIKQLSEEIGASPATLPRHLSDLKAAGLVGTYHPIEGGTNYYEFYHHEWMDAPINENLSYKSEQHSDRLKTLQNDGEEHPHADMHVPPCSSARTPHADVHALNKKEIKVNKKEICTSVPEMLPSAENGKKDKPQVTRETASYIAIWNELAIAHGLKPVGQDKRQLNAIHKSLQVIKKEWDVKLTEKNFRVWLTQGVNAKHYRLSKFKHRLDICLRWDAFIEIYTLEGVNRVENK